MMFITGPLYSGKRTFARNFRGSVIADVQAARADCVVQMFCGIPTVLKGELPQC